jgi:hypothetical protein
MLTRRALRVRCPQRRRSRCLRGGLESLEPRMMLTTYLVDSLEDFLPPDNLAMVPADGALTLREALLAASLKTAVGDAPPGTASNTIRFAPDLFGTIELAGVPLEIAAGGSLEIVGPGSAVLAISAQGSSRVLAHRSGTTRLSGLMITAGSAGDGSGGGIVHHSGSLTLDRVEFLENVATRGGGLASLGGTATVIDCHFAGNHADFGGAIYNEAGGLSIRAPSMLVERTAIVSNLAGTPENGPEQAQGGGIYNLNSFLVVRDSTIEGNVAQGGTQDSDRGGGGIYNYSESAPGGGVRIERSTISGNEAVEGLGAGIYSMGSASAGDATRLEIFNSTVSGNGNHDTLASDLSEGGGIYNGVHSDLAIIDSTIAFNIAYQGGGVSNHSGLLQLSNSIVIGNTAEIGWDFYNAVSVASGPAPVYNILGHEWWFNDERLNSDNHNHTGVFAGDILLELADNGGLTKTHALRTDMDNPAIDGGSSDVIIDQRGKPIQNQRDIGAFESQQRFASSPWSSEVRAASQWGPGAGLRFGVGFDLPEDQSIQEEPEFLGFEFDTGPLVLGKIKTTRLGRFGGELRVDIAGRFGLEYGYYVDSGTLDVNYDGLLSYSITTEDGRTRLDTALDIENGSLYTVSPRVGAYADLVFDLDANISARACFVGCFGASLPLSIHETLPLFSINRQDENGDFDGEIRFGGEPVQKKEKDLDPKKAAQILADDKRYADDWRLQAADMPPDDPDRIALEDAADNSATRQQVLDQVKRQAEIDVRAGQRALDKAATADEKAKAQRAIDKAKKKIETTKKLQKTSDDRAENMVKGAKIGGGTGLQFSFGEASGSLLGLETTVSVGAGIDGVANVAKEIGTLALTLPDIQLTDIEPDITGRLSATTKDFEKGSLQDDKRQLAKVSLDLGGLVGPLIGIPAGRYSLSLGPLGLNVQLVSYDIVPRLSVNQAVDVVPYAKSAAFDFGQPVDVWVNGVRYDKDQDGTGKVTTVEFTPGDSIEIDSGGSEISVTPRLHLGNRFTNDIGLDVDLKGIFEAFSLNLSLFNKPLINVGPLLTHETTFAEFNLGSVFDRTFDLQTAEQTLGSFTLGGSPQAVAGFAANPLLVSPLLAADGGAGFAQERVAADGESGTAQNPLRVANVVTFIPNQVQSVADPLVFVAVPLLEADGTLYTEVQVDLAGNTLQSIGVIRDGLVYQALPGGNEVSLERGVLFKDASSSFRLAGFDAGGLSESSTALLVLKFSSPGDETTLTVTRTLPVASPVLTTSDERLPREETRPAEINRDAVAQANAVSVASDDAMDVNGDGKRDASIDGVLTLRYLFGFRGDVLVAGIDLSQGTRATAAEIEDYLGVLERQGRLDADGNGAPDALSDGILFLRQHSGFVGEALVDGALGDGRTRVTGEEVRRFVIGEKVTASQTPIPKRDDDGNVVLDKEGQPVLVQGTGFDIPEILDRIGGDPLGLKDVNQPDDDAVPGSSAWVPLPPALEEGAWRQYSLTTYGRNVEFTRLLRDGVPIAVTAQGNPTSGLLEDQGLAFADANGDLDEEAIEGFSDEVTSEVVSRVLGVQASLFLDTPDAAAYAFRVENGFSLASLAIDLLAGDTALIDPVFDLFLPTTEAWTEVDLSQPFTLPAGTTEFQLFSRALPNQVAARSTNRVRSADGTLSDELQPSVSNFRVPFGLTFADGAAGQTPVIQVQTVPRQPVHDPPALRGSEGFSMSVFRLVRDGADAFLECADLSCEDPPVRTIQIASATRAEVIGTEFGMDTLVIDASGGPLQMLPIVFRGSDGGGDGQSDDTLVVAGSGVTVDLHQNVTLFDVETIDIRGTGVNSVDVSAAAVFDNLGTNRVFYVLLDPGEDQHNVDAAHDWVFENEIERDDRVYGLFWQAYPGNADLEKVFAAIYRRAAHPPSSLMALDAAFDDLVLLTDDSLQDEMVL